MNKLKLASELVRIAKELTSKSITAIDFHTQHQMDKYLKEHPDSKRSDHRVVDIKKMPEDELKNKNAEHLDQRSWNNNQLTSGSSSWLTDKSRAFHKNEAKTHHSLHEECEKELKSRQK